MKLLLYKQKKMRLGGGGERVIRELLLHFLCPDPCDDAVCNLTVYLLHKSDNHDINIGSIYKGQILNR